MMKEKRLKQIYAEDTEKLLSTYSEDVRAFLESSDTYNSYQNIKNKNSVIRSKLKEHLENGGKPSEFFEKLDMPGYISDEYFKKFCYSVDSVINWQIGIGYYRRTFRAKEYIYHIERIITILRLFRLYSYGKMTAEAAVKGEISDEVESLLPYYATYEYLIAAELDMGNKNLESALEEAVFEDNGKMYASFFRGIVMSKSTKLYDALGKLLLAARLQEGLRQAVCENMDAGREEAFLHLFKVVLDNDLLRFSSIKRSFWTWTGLYTEQIKDLDRITNKQAFLIYDFLSDEKKREAALKSEDSMELYMALWSYSTTDLTKAANIAKNIAFDGTKHQRLTASFFLNVLGSNIDLKFTAKALVDKFGNELDTMGIIFDRFMSSSYDDAWIWEKLAINDSKKIFVDYKEFFKDDSECRHFYYVLKEMLSFFKGKEAVFEPCVFPWASARLKRSEIVKKMAWCAASLQDNDLIDEVSDMLQDVGNARDYYTASRDAVLVLLLSDPKTEKQRKTLIAAVANAETSTRDTAFKLVKKLILSDDEYLMLEDMLKYKKADVRKNIINLLMEQNHEKRLASVERLLKDKKEEKRTAALDMLIQLKKIDNSEKICELASSVASPTAKEKILVDEILSESRKDKKSGFGLYDPSADYTPELEGEYIEECKKIFMDYFPASKAFNIQSKKKYNDKNIVKKLKSLIAENENLEYKNHIGDTRLLKDPLQPTYYKDGKREYPFMDMWHEFYDKEIKDVSALFRLFLFYRWRRSEHTCFDELTAELFGKEFAECDFKNDDSGYNMHLSAIFHALLSEKYENGEFEPSKLASAAAYYIVKQNKQIKYEREYTDSWRKGHKYTTTVFEDEILNPILSSLRENVAAFPYNYALLDKIGFESEMPDCSYTLFNEKYGRRSVSVPQFIHACAEGIITKDFLLKFLLYQGVRETTFESLSSYIQFIREKDKLDNDTAPIWLKKRRYGEINRLLGHNPDEKADTDEKYLALAEDCYNKITDCVLDVELSRGDMPTVFSLYIRYIDRIYGARNFVKILNALGSETLERSISYYYSGGTDKKNTLSHLLKHCIPEPGKKAEDTEIIKNSGIPRKKLIEAAMYSTEWLDIIGDVLGEDGFVSGCYYFIAHMNDTHSEMQKAMIAKYTPLSIDELNNGAFDVNWFREVYDVLGEKSFDMIYAAAKYITDGAKHSRARKYADAALGKLETTEIEKLLKDKRNKDLLMAYPLIPYKDEKDVKKRYLFIQSFLKESKQFGAQRRASEKLACETAVKNMATMLGYPDETRLILTVEGGIAEDMKDLFTPAAADDVMACIEIDEAGKVDIVCEKEGKRLKSVPTRLKKNERINTLKEAKKTLNDQRSRVIKMLECAMESETEFKYGELVKMLKSPVVKNQAERLVFKKGKTFGSFADFSDSGKNDILQIAHPYHLYKAGVWKEWQERLFGAKIKQPFKQVFRELYVKTDEEADSARSMRYSGNQINPQRTAACLKGRGWIADYESGLQKIYYKENIIAEIYALADWFSPSDIESPTLEYVVFTDRKTFGEKKIKDIPDVVFSEIMRDVDLAVSVAHAGGVDPEMSHSTVEMRHAIAELTANMLALENVVFTETHAVIKGSRAEYSLHLGSGVIHIKGGAMLNILPVYSQQRGRIFLPFVDDDPKTAEILSKLIMLSEDKKIKDPYILEQLK